MKKACWLIFVATVLAGCAGGSTTKHFGYEPSPCACVEFKNHAQG